MNRKTGWIVYFSLKSRIREKYLFLKKFLKRFLLKLTDTKLAYACSAKERGSRSRRRTIWARAREKGGGGREKIGVEQVIWGKHENVKRLRELRQVADKNTQG